MTVDLDPRHRAAAVRSDELLGHQPRPDLSAIADLAARICGTSRAAVNLMTDDELHQVATTDSTAAPVCSLEESMCGQVMHEPSPVVVPDTREHPVLSANPFVDGRYSDVRSYASAQLVNRQGVVLGTLCVFDDAPRDLDATQVDALRTLADRVVDILELVLRTRELHQSLVEVVEVRAQLERSNERLASFAGQVSHDLKTPLTSMTASLSLIREELAADGVAAAALPLLDRAVAGSLRMGALIDDVLAFAVLGDVDHARVDLAAVLDDVRADLGERLEGVELVVEDLPVVHGNAAQLRALLQNLVDNAVKFGGATPPAVVVVRSCLVPSGRRVEVVDNGRGVAAADRERVFDPLQRVDAAMPGTGIGLTTCRRVVEAHGGRIGLAEAEGGGTLAWFELPDLVPPSQP